MKRFALIATAAVLVLFGGAVAIIDWAMDDGSPPELPDQREAPTPREVATAIASSQLAVSSLAVSPVALPAERAVREPSVDATDGGPADADRRDGERVLDELELAVLDSDPVRRCVAEGAAPGSAEIRLTVDPSGVTYRFGTSVDAATASCLMMEALPGVLGTFSTPSGLRRAERDIRIPVD